MKKKLCSVLLALCMVLTLLPVSALADDGGNSPCIVSNLAELKTAIANGGYIKLANDIAFTFNECTNQGSSHLDPQVEITKNVTLDLNGNSIKVDASVTQTDLGKCSPVLFSIMNGSTVTITGNGTLNTEAGNNQVYGINVYDGNLIVENGTFYGAITAIQVQKGNLVIYDGHFDMAPTCKKAVPQYAKYVDNAIDSSYKSGDAKLAIYGGTFVNFDPSNNPEGANTSYLATSGYQVTASSHDSDTWYTIEKKSNNVASIGNTEYATLAEAITAASNATVTLLANTTESVNIPADKTITLNLNGNDITAADSHAIENHGNLTIIGSGTVSTSKSGKAALANYPDAVANVNGGTYISSGWYIIKNLGTMTIDGAVTLKKPEGSTDTSSLVDNGWYGNNSNDMSQTYPTSAVEVKLTIKSGEFNFNAAAGKKSCSVIKNDDYGVLLIEGGTFDSTLNTSNESATTIMNWNVATISGGTFRGSYPLSNGAYANEADKGLLTVTGGNFVGTGTIFGNGVGGDGKGAATISGGTFTAPALGAEYDNVKGGYTVSISGGTYSINPDHVADGYIARKDGDAQFTVIAKSNLTSGTYMADPAGFLAAGYVSYANGDGTYTVYYPVPVTPGNTSSTTTTNPDGSTTTTTTDKATGTVTTVTKYPDGSTTTVETKKDGSVTETNKTAGGSVGTVKSDANGKTEISASISGSDISAAEKKGEPVIAPVTVTPAASSAAAPVIKVSVPASAGEVSVAIPVTNAQQGTVAIRVNADGTEEIIKTSIVTENGVVLGVKGTEQIKIINNDKDFIDTVGHWAESDVDFVSARELFNGTGPATFSPEASMTRGMVVTVLARLAGENTDGGENWYDKGCAWAVANGVSDGTDPNGSITREQLAAMLYRYAGSPTVSGSLSTYADAASVSDYATSAMQWCVNNGIITGMDGLLNPQGQATRAQVSAMFARYIRLMATK